MKFSASLPMRKSEDSGDGAFGASRAGGTRVHYGIDLACYPDTVIFANMEGEVTKLGYPYEFDDSDPIIYKYVQITDPEGRDHRYFYVTPSVLLGGIVAKGDEIGVSQDISARYPPPQGKAPMTNHMHYEVKVGPGKTAADYLDPTEFLS